eukprot:TRINITY_DN83250_c0_g1_i1.p1 TRINITY_DN83250_c0_g1~~TRINITY_DN83250_c0_g1_i1.p1  ORF type:complete len:327 (-),score=53.99 TRINITY_DN83250_c0_g1_i1:71-1051(-)
MAKTVLVTGGAGYVGQFVVQALLESGYDVHVTHRPGRVPSGLPQAVQLHELDAGWDAEAVAAVLRGVGSITAVVNCVAMSGIGACEKDPVAAKAINEPTGLVEAFSASATADDPKLFIHFSTDIVFDGDPSKLYNEDSETLPVNTYGKIKAHFDDYLKACTSPACVVLRPTNIVGPIPPYPSASNGGTKFLQWLDGRLRTDAPSNLFDDEYRNYVWVEDLVDVTLKLIADFPSKPPPHSIMHCGGPDSLNRVQVAEALAAAKGYALTYKDDQGIEQPRIIPSPRASVDLGYPSPLCIRFQSSRVEAYLGRGMRKISDAIVGARSRI